MNQPTATSRHGLRDALPVTTDYTETPKQRAAGDGWTALQLQIERDGPTAPEHYRWAEQTRVMYDDSKDR